MVFFANPAALYWMSIHDSAVGGGQIWIDMTNILKFFDPPHVRKEKKLPLSIGELDKKLLTPYSKVSKFEYFLNPSPFSILSISLQSLHE